MKCAKCGSELDPGESFCGECGQPVQASAASPTAGQVAVATCPKCGANADPGKRFCSSCGHDLAAAGPKAQPVITYPAVGSAQPVTASTSSSSSRIALIIGLVALFGILFLGSASIALWMWFGDRANATNQNTATPSKTATISGKWKCVFTSPNETETGNMSLVQNGATITGTLTDGTTEQISGTFDGQNFSFNIPNTEVRWQLALSPDGSNMKGEVQYEEQKGTLLCTR